MHVGRPFTLRATAGLALVSLVAACSVAGGATSAPVASVAPVAPVASVVSAAPAAASPEPSAGPSAGLPSPAPSAVPTPTATPASNGGGGRYGTGGGSTPTPAPVAKLTVRSARTGLGTVLVGSDGLTLYVHAGDSATHSSCTGSCATAWPPLLVKSGTKVSGGSGVPGKFATFKRADGTTQVTYNGRPLYAWTGDYYPGDTTGQGVGGFSVAKV